MSITPIKKDKKSLIRLKSGKLVERELDPRVILIPKTNEYLELEKELNILRKKIMEKDEIIKEYEEKLSGNILEQQNEHLQYELNQYELHCFKDNRDIQLTICSDRINRNICSNDCGQLNKKLKNMNFPSQ